VTLPGVISNFLTDGTGWSQYAVYSDHNFPHSKLNDLLSGRAVTPTTGEVLGVRRVQAVALASHS